MGSEGALESLDSLEVPNKGTLLLDSCSLLGGAGLWIARYADRPLNRFRGVLLSRLNEYSILFSAPKNGIGLTSEVFHEVDKRIRILRRHSDSELKRALDELEEVLDYKTSRIEDATREVLGTRLGEYAERLIGLEGRCLRVRRYQVKGKRMSLPDARLVITGTVLSECDGGCHIVSDDRGLRRGVTIIGEQKNHFKDLARDLGIHPKTLSRRTPAVYAWGKQGPYRLRKKKVRKIRPRPEFLNTN